MKVGDLKKLSAQVNILDLLDEDDSDDKRFLDEIKKDVKRGFEEDLQSRSQWENTVKEVMKIALMSIENKSYPWPGCSNVKYPLIPMTCLRFAADTYPMIVKNGKLVYMDVAGQDPTGTHNKIGTVLADHMSYQNLVESTTWETHMDRTLHMGPLVGVAFKKIYYDKSLEQNVSELIPFEEFVVNDNIKSLETAPRQTHIIRKTTNEIIELIRYGQYVPVDCEELEHTLDDGQDYHELHEQHCFIDLDDDDYAEPYIVTYHEKLNKLLRIVARFDLSEVKYNEDKEVCHIPAVQYFQDFHCIPRPDGKFHSLGLGTILLHTNLVINSLVNALIDKGHMSNNPPVFTTNEVQLPGGFTSLAPGQVNKIKTLGPDVDIDKQIKIVDLGEPSPTLQSTLELMISSGREFSSMTEISTGAQSAENVKSGVMQTLDSNSKKVFSAIQKRWYKSLGQEFTKLYRLNTIYLPQMAEFKNDKGNFNVSKEMYKQAQSFLRPVADPSLASITDRQEKYSAVFQLATQFPSVINVQELIKAYLAEGEVPQPERFIAQPKQPQPSPDVTAKLQAEAQQHQAETQIRMQELQLAQQQAQTDATRTQADIQKMQAQAAQAFATAAQTKMDTTLSTEDQYIAHQQQMLEGKKLDLERTKVLQKHIDVILEHNRGSKQIGIDQQRADQEKIANESKTGGVDPESSN